MSTQVNNEGFSKNEQIVSEAIPPLLKRHTNCSGDWQQEGCIPPALAVKDIEDYFHVNKYATHKQSPRFYPSFIIFTSLMIYVVRIC